MHAQTHMYTYGIFNSVARLLKDVLRLVDRLLNKISSKMPNDLKRKPQIQIQNKNYDVYLTENISISFFFDAGLATRIL